MHRGRLLAGLGALVVFVAWTGAATGADAPTVVRPGDWYFPPDGLDPRDRIGAFFPSDPAAVDIQDPRRTRCSRYVEALPASAPDAPLVVVPLRAPADRITEAGGDPAAETLVAHVRVTTTWEGRVSDETGLALCCHFHPKDCGDFVSSIQVATGHVERVRAADGVPLPSALTELKRHQAAPDGARPFVNEPVVYGVSAPGPFIDGACSPAERDATPKRYADRAVVGRWTDADPDIAWTGAFSEAVFRVMRRLRSDASDDELKLARSRAISVCPETVAREDGKTDVSAIFVLDRADVGGSAAGVVVRVATTGAATATVDGEMVGYTPEFPESWIREDRRPREETCEVDVFLGPDRRARTLTFVACTDSLRAIVERAVLTDGRDLQLNAPPDGKVRVRFIFRYR